MRIRTETGNGHHSMDLAGRFDAHEVAGFRAAVELLVASGAGASGDPAGVMLKLDLANVIFVDSSALAELLRTQKTVRQTGGDLILTALSDPVRVILELTALGQVFTTEEVENAQAPSA
jgi:anti-sigma B factor antagonist